jgi:hypothetical protein
VEVDEARSEDEALADPDRLVDPAGPSLALATGPLVQPTRSLLLQLPHRRRIKTITHGLAKVQVDERRRKRKTEDGLGFWRFVPVPIFCI